MSDPAEQEAQLEEAATREAGAISLQRFAQMNYKICIRSEVLGDYVWFVSDNRELPGDPLGHYRGRVVYRARELDLLVAQQTTPDDLRAIHQVKKYAGGVVEKAAAGPAVLTGTESADKPLGVAAARKLLAPYEEMWKRATAGLLPQEEFTLRQGVTVTDPNRKVLSCYSEAGEIARGKVEGAKWRARLTDLVRDLQALAARYKQTV